MHEHPCMLMIRICLYVICTYGSGFPVCLKNPSEHQALLCSSISCLEMMQPNIFRPWGYLEVWKDNDDWVEKVMRHDKEGLTRNRWHIDVSDNWMINWPTEIILLTRTDAGKCEGDEREWGQNKKVMEIKDEQKQATETTLTNSAISTYVSRSKQHSPFLSVS